MAIDRNSKEEIEKDIEFLESMEDSIKETDNLMFLDLRLRISQWKQELKNLLNN